MSQWQQQIASNAAAISKILADAKTIGEHSLLAVSLQLADKILLEKNADGQTVHTTIQEIVDLAALPSTIPVTTKGDLVVYDTSPNRLGVGANGEVLTVDLSTPSGLKWAVSLAGAQDLQSVTGLGSTTTLGIRTNGYEIDDALNYLKKNLGELNLSSDSNVKIETSVSGAFVTVGSNYVELNTVDGVQTNGVRLSTANSTALRTFTFANYSGVIPMTVNNITPDALGNIQVTGLSVPLTTKGDIYTFSTTEERLAVGADGFVLIADSSEPTGLRWQAGGGGGVTDHTLLTNIGTNTHVQIDSHIADSTLHFVENPNWNTAFGWGDHSGLYMPLGQQLAVTKTLVADEYFTSYDAVTGLFTSAVITGGVSDHTLLTNIGTNTHAQIDTHLADATIHFTQGAISIPLTQGANDVTATFGELNLLDLAGLTIGWVLSADSANTASWKAATYFTPDTLLADYGYTEPTHALADLTDVDASVGTPSDGDILVWRTAGNDWILETKPVPGGGGATQLNELSDVTNVQYTNRHVLVADGTDYDSRLLVEADISDLGSYALATHTHTLSDITDVTATAAEVNLLDLSGLTAGWVLSADSATIASWKAPSGGSASPLTTKGDLYTFSTVDARLGVGTDGQVVEADSAEPTGLKWVTPQKNNDVNSTGLLSGGVLSVGAGASEYSISDGTGQIVDQAGNKTLVSWSGKTNITPTNILGGLISFIGIDIAGNVVEQLSNFTPLQTRSIIALGVVLHFDNTTVNGVNNEQHPSYNVMSQLYDLGDAIGFFNTSGNIFSPNGVNLSVDKSVGDLFKMGSNYDTNVNNPHNKTLAAKTATDIIYRFSDGTPGATGTTIDPDNIDNNSGGLTALGNNEWSIQRIYSFISNNVIVQRGAKSYSSKADAINGISTENYITEPSIKANGLLRAWLVVKEGTTDLSNIPDAEFIEAPKFGSGSGTAGGASPFVPTQLSDLTDVNTSTPTNRNVLVADGVDWESRLLVEADISDLGTYLTSFTETDPIFVASPANSTTNANGTNTGDNAVNTLYSGLVTFPGFSTVAGDYAGITSTDAELNLLDLSGLTAGWVLSADTATTASWKAPVGGAPAYGTTTQIPYMNAGGDGFLYDPDLTFNGSQFIVYGANSTYAQLSQGQLTLQGTLKSYNFAPSSSYIRYASGFNFDLAFPTDVATSNKTVTFKDESGTVALLSDISGGGATTLSELTDVTSATQTAGFALISDGGNYFGRALVEADISNLGTYSTDIHANIAALNNVSGTNTGDNAVNTLYSGLVSFPGFTSLLVDYGFTDNSTNWNTAFGWGDHAGLYLVSGTQLAQTKNVVAGEFFTSYDATTGLFTSAIPPNDNDNDIDYVSNVTSSLGVLSFTGVGNAFNSTVDLKTYFDTIYSNNTGTIGGTIADTQIPFGDTTANTIRGTSGFTYAGSTLGLQGSGGVTQITQGSIYIAPQISGTATLEGGNLAGNARTILDFGAPNTNHTIQVPNLTGTLALTNQNYNLAQGAVDVTATASEVNLLDLSGLTTGWVLSADSATTASWKAPTASAPATTTTANTGTAISLGNNIGNYCNMASANTNTTFTTTGSIAGGFARVLINTASQPTVTGGTLEQGAQWVAGEMYMDVYYDGATVKYYFVSTDSAADTAPITLTTTGTSGVATLIGTVLNIPNYAAGGGTIGGSITDNQIAVGSSTANNIEGGADFTWNGGTSILTLGLDGSNIARIYFAVGGAGTLTYDDNTSNGFTFNERLTVSGNSITGNSFIKIGATADDVLLGDGTTTSLAGIGGGATTLSQLTDVVSATNTNRFALMANGTTGYVGRALVEADISDLTHFSPSNLATDYGFTDNSTNWNTAFGWGDHSIQGYLTNNPTLSKSTTIADPVATDDATMFFTPVAITVTDVRSHITGATNVVFNISHATTRNGTPLDVFTSNITLTSTSGQSNSTGFNDATIPANSWVWIDIASVSGTPTMFHTTVIYTED